MNLYQISENLRALGEVLAEQNGELTPQAEAAFTAWEAELESDLHDKLDGYCALIREMEARAEIREGEAERLNALARADAVAADRLRERLHRVFTERALPPQKTKRFAIRLSRNGGKAPVLFSPWVAEAPERLPERFRRIHCTGNMAAIREALEAGEALEFASLGERATRIDIR